MLAIGIILVALNGTKGGRHRANALQKYNLMLYRLKDPKSYHGT